jgi:glycosyltransferase involved in cell wall biosynthesis
MESLGDDVSLVNSFSAPALLYTPIYALRPLLFRRWLKGIGTFWYRYWHYRFLLWGLTRHLKAHHVDVINAQCPLSAKAALLARRRTRSDCKVVLTCHFNVSQADEFVIKGELHREGGYYKKIQSLEQRMLNSVDGTVFVSGFSQREICNRHALNNINSRVIYNGIAKQIAEQAIPRKQLDIPEDAFVVISVGTLEPRKNQHAWVNAMLDLLRTHPRLHLLLIGDGQDRKQIESLVSESGMEGQVKLLGFRSDVSRLLRSADAYCHPALMESLGIAVIEAAEAGLPIIASNAGGIPEILDHLQSGVLINRKEGDEAFAFWIKKLLDDPGLCSQLGNAARKAFLTKFTEEAMAQSYMGYFRELRNSPA